MSRSLLKAPFPYFGGKSRVARQVWERLGRVKNYIEPFCGSAAVLLSRPDFEKGLVETVNDWNGYLVNFWRAIQQDPIAVAQHADYPVSELDLIARHRALLQETELSPRLKSDPLFYCPRIAGWWVWGINIWIGSGWCETDAEQIPHLGDAGTGINRKLPHLGDAGTGVNRLDFLSSWMTDLSDRLRDVRICCGDWRRVLTPSVTTKHGTTGVFLDPPYHGVDVNHDVNYGTKSVWEDVCQWCEENGHNPDLRIALCGYEGGFDPPPSWITVKWKANGGYSGKKNNNRKRERIWFSPHCLHDGPLFACIE